MTYTKRKPIIGQKFCKLLETKNSFWNQLTFNLIFLEYPGADPPPEGNVEKGLIQEEAKLAEEAEEKADDEAWNELKEELWNKDF